MKKLMLSVICVAGLQAGAYELTSGKLRVEFESAADGYAIRQLVNTYDGENRFVNIGDGHADFWSVQFVRKGAQGLEYVTLSNRCASQRSVEEKDGEIIFHWRAMPLKDEADAVEVTARVKAVPARNAAEWTMEVICHSQEWAVNYTQYPMLRKVLPEGEGDMLIPVANFGARLCRNNQAERGTWLKDDSWSYPGWYPQVMAFWKTDKAGLYFAAEDPEARLKTMYFKEDTTIYMQTTVEGAGIADGKARSPKYKVVTAAFCGDWWKVAALYKDWALKAPWTQKGTMAARADYPKRLAETHIMYRLEAVRDIQGVIPQYEAAHKQMGDMPLAFHWYSWNNEAFNANYPHFSPRPGAVKLFSDFQSRGDLLMPYVNGRLWDVANEDYPEGVKMALQKIDGTPWAEDYPQSKNSIMCAGYKPWQETIVKNAKLMYEDCKVNSIYFDQVCCAPGFPCYNAQHGHAIGGGKWWKDGYHDAFTTIHELARRNAASLITEGAGEWLMDVIDGYLICGQPPLTREVPFYPAVYSGYTTYLGSDSPENTEVDSFNAFYARQISLVFWGVELGRWIPNRWLKTDAAKQQELVRKLAKLREEYKEFLVYGSLIDELRTVKPQTIVTYEYVQIMKKRNQGLPEHIPYPAITGYWWRNADKSKRALFAANVTDEERVATVVDGDHTIALKLKAHEIAVKVIAP